MRVKVGLFDLYSSGHHLPYASIVNTAMGELPTSSVNFITLSATEKQSEFFVPDDIVYLDAPDSPPVEERDDDFTEIADRRVSQLASLVSDDNYDLIYFLYIDDIMGAIWRNWPETDDLRTVGDLIGPYFTRQTLLRRPYTHPVLLRTLRSRLAPVLDVVVPDATSHEALWRDLLLYRCLEAGKFDIMISHSEEARRYVTRFGFDQLIETIPFPVPIEYSTTLTRKEARSRLDLSESDTILLFFGTLRNEKGIDLLLEALREYTGPEFRLLIAGPPVAVDSSDIEAEGLSESVAITTELDYIDNPQPYYRASDGVVMPYRRVFGRENMSMIFQEACGAQRPIIGPEFGVMGRLIEEWGLGITFTPGSPSALADVLSQFVRGEVEFSDRKLKEYARRHASDRVTTMLAESLQEI